MSVQFYKFSAMKVIISTFCGPSLFLFFVTTSPALENKRSLSTEVAGMPSSWRATVATAGFSCLFEFHHLNGQDFRGSLGSARYSSYSRCKRSQTFTSSVPVLAPGELKATLLNFAQSDVLAVGAVEVGAAAVAGTGVVLVEPAPRLFTTMTSTTCVTIRATVSTENRRVL